MESPNKVKEQKWLEILSKPIDVNFDSGELLNKASMEIRKIKMCASKLVEGES